ncbi:hypothetical protein TYRP_023434, partial [Tyrophagus putrescentiae]
MPLYVRTILARVDIIVGRSRDSIAWKSDATRRRKILLPTRSSDVINTLIDQHSASYPFAADLLKNAFYIPRVNRIIDRVLRLCVPCQKSRLKLITQPVSDFPQFWHQDYLPFGNIASCAVPRTVPLKFEPDYAADACLAEKLTPANLCCLSQSNSEADSFIVSGLYVNLRALCPEPCRRLILLEVESDGGRAECQGIFLEVMAPDEAIREGSRAWSGGWLSHRLAAAQHLACELSDDVNVRRAFPRVVSPPHTVFSIRALGHSANIRAAVSVCSSHRAERSVDRLPSARPSSPASLPCRAPCPVPEPLSLVSRALAPIRPERPSPPTSTSYLLPLPLTLYRLNISLIVRAPLTGVIWLIGIVRRLGTQLASSLCPKPSVPINQMTPAFNIWGIFLEVMASDKAIRERSRAWSGGWLSHRLAAAQHLACELSDDVNVRGAFPRVVSPPHTVSSIQALGLKHSEAPSTGCPVRAHHHRRPLCRAVPCPVPRAPCPVPRPRAVPEPLSLDSRAFAPIRPEWPFTTYFFFIFVTLPLTLYRLNISTIVRARASLLSTGPTPAPVPISLLFLSHLRGRNS